MNSQEVKFRRNNVSSIAFCLNLGQGYTDYVLQSSFHGIPPITLYHFKQHEKLIGNAAIEVLDSFLEENLKAEMFLSPIDKKRGRRLLSVSFDMGWTQ